ncbi:MAG TPA: ammonia-dependent NAD(+) synthetase [Jiangellaceae bacterium]|nr:ammonia-dependent NAD(+) synthetase [Jiangellaceae bacterium]
MDAHLHRVQRQIIHELGVTTTFDSAAEAERRVGFLADLLASTGRTTLVLAISGGIDSATAGALCARAVQRRRAVDPSSAFVAMRLPYSRQADEADADLVIEVLDPDKVLTADIQPASDSVLETLEKSGLRFDSLEERDFALGNIKARERMIMQYAVAGTLRGLVVGTDHAAEAVTGFFTKYGDGGVDVVPLSGLTKGQVRALGKHLGIPDRITNKVPTADLHTLIPQRPDEDELGLTYEQIDAFLEGKPVGREVATRLIERYRLTAHKRATPTAPTA